MKDKNILDIEIRIHSFSFLRVFKITIYVQNGDVRSQSFESILVNRSHSVMPKTEDPKTRHVVER